MARSYLYAFVVAAVVSLARWASAAGAILASTIERVFEAAFPVTAPVAPVSPSLAAPAVIGLAETRAYKARRERRIVSDLSIGCVLAA